MGSAGDTVAGTSAPDLLSFSTATLSETPPQNKSQFSDRVHVTNRDRSRSSENRYGRNPRSRYVDKTTWNQMNEDFGPGGVIPKNEPSMNRFAQNPPFKTQTVNAEPGSLRILQRNEPVVFETKNTDEPNVVATGNFRRSPGMWLKCEVEDLPCWAIVDTGASTSLISRHMACLVGKPVNPHPHRLLGPIGNVMPIDGKMLAEVTFGKHKSTDEFIVVDELYPHALISLKFLCDNKCQVDIENETLKIRIRDQAETTVPLYVGDRLEPPTDERACVLQTEAEIEETAVTNEILEKNDDDVNEIVELAASDLQDSQIKESLSSLIGIYRDVFALAKDPLGTAIGTEHFIDTNDNPPFEIAPYKVLLHINCLGCKKKSRTC